MLNVGSGNRPGHEHGSLYCQWHLQAFDNNTGEKIYEDMDTNVVTDLGRFQAIALLFNLGGSSFIALGAGACSTTAQHTDFQLNYEHILNGNRVIPTDQAGNPLSLSDIITETFTDGFGETYYRKIIMRGQFFGATDHNVNQPFQEYGFFTATTSSGSVPYGGKYSGQSSACPSTPFNVSGVMYNHYVASSPIVLTSNVTLIVDTTIRL